MARGMNLVSNNLRFNELRKAFLVIVFDDNGRKKSMLNLSIRKFYKMFWYISKSLFLIVLQSISFEKQ